MKIKNLKNKANYLNFRSGGVPKKILIPAGKTADIPGLTSILHVLNYGDFTRGHFGVVQEVIEVKEPAKEVKAKKAKKSSDSLDKVKQEVRDYTGDKENKTKSK